ncbi:TetR/AcrR family transcriptional regulator [Rhodococcus wratislaviensis]|uniref:TetR/AcrR family transcriptional regulator n=1 Tax=Rhodococcus wratislaviensis TaxID=44752 RepID=UPI00365B71C2
MGAADGLERLVLHTSCTDRAAAVSRNRYCTLPPWANSHFFSGLCGAGCLLAVDLLFLAAREAAARLFYEHGYEATSLRTVASEVGIQVGSLYNHISGKEELPTDIMVSVRPNDDLPGRPRGVRPNCLESAGSSGLATSYEGQPGRVLRGDSFL